MTTTQELCEALDGKMVISTFTKDGFMVKYWNHNNTFQARYMHDDTIRFTLGTSDQPAEDLAKIFNEALDSTWLYQ